MNSLGIDVGKRCIAALKDERGDIIREILINNTEASRTPNT